ncbi:hypothetical protein PG993_006190 [Apiospora rasikravindrae]|uniref:Fungal N-terminal domain-containing protein n=1 Tax=Apiospora rasikravindrae TaxID=990691 RepID=A0ABR1T502_9PEZI
MADVLALVITAAQAAEYCLKLCGLFDRLYHATETSRSYQERLQGLTPLLRQIEQEPSFNTPEITNCTRSLAATLEPLTFLNATRSPRILSSISFVIKEKRFGRIFDSIEEKKSTLSLYIAKITLNEIRIGLRSCQQLSDTRTMDYQPDPMDEDEDDGPYLTQRQQEGVVEREQYDEQGRSTRIPWYRGAQANIMVNDINYRQILLTSGQIVTVSEHPYQHPSNNGSADPDTYGNNTQQSSVSLQRSYGIHPEQPASDANATPPNYIGNVMTGHGPMHNGHKVKRPITDERMLRITKGKVFYGNIKERRRSTRKRRGATAGRLRDSQHNGVDFQGVYPAAHDLRYEANYMNADGVMHNGDII